MALWFLFVGHLLIYNKALIQVSIRKCTCCLNLAGRTLELMLWEQVSRNRDSSWRVSLVGT